ncbi:MAG: porin, partial [Pedobacter sp.]
MKKLLLLAAALTTGTIAYGQEEPKIKVTGYLETYFGYDFNKP